MPNQMIELVENSGEQPSRMDSIKLIIKPHLPHEAKYELTPKEMKNTVRSYQWLKSHQLTANRTINAIKTCVNSIVKHKYDSLMIMAQEEQADDGDMDDDSDEHRPLIKRSVNLGSGVPSIAGTNMSQSNPSRSENSCSIRIREDSEGNEDDGGAHSTRKVSAERIFVVTNFILEVPSAIFNQLSSNHKTEYALVSMLLSFMTMLICIIELVYNGGEGKVAWNWRKKIPWFYYPPPSHERPFGTVVDFIGLFCGIFQCIFAAIAYVCLLRGTDNPVKISAWPLVFAFCLLCSKFSKNPHKKIL
ncbi:hypothetical protein ACOSQ3_004335 [Xanthoceras sorbifolium]